MQIVQAFFSRVAFGVLIQFVTMSGESWYDFLLSLYNDSHNRLTSARVTNATRPMRMSHWLSRPSALRQGSVSTKAPRPILHAEHQQQELFQLPAPHSWKELRLCMSRSKQLVAPDPGAEAGEAVAHG